MSTSPRILYFGKLTDLTGKSEETEAPPSSIADTTSLRQWIDNIYDGGGALLDATIRIAVDNEIVAEPAPIVGAAEIAFMPPVGGG
ncbi:MAG: MoaD/ThiS family protein [Pseudomonadota bacterium]